MVDPEQALRRLSDLCKLAMVRKWLNVVASQSKIACGLLLQSSHAGQTHGELKTLAKEQIKQKLIAFEGEAKSSKTRSVTKWWSRRASMAIAKAAYNDFLVSYHAAFEQRSTTLADFCAGHCLSSASNARSSLFWRSLLDRSKQPSLS